MLIGLVQNQEKELNIEGETEQGSEEAVSEVATTGEKSVPEWLQKQCGKSPISIPSTWHQGVEPYLLGHKGS
jgi:hypothetical protein